MKNTANRKDFIFAFIILAAIPTAIAAEELPSMELLEFLGEWETKEGEWIDPTTLVDTEVAESKEVDYVNTAEEQSDEQ